LEFIALSFSLDGKHLAILTGGPDYNLDLWAWEKVKLLASIKVAQLTTDKYTTHGTASPAPTYEVQFNPIDPSQIFYLVNGVIKILLFQEGAL